MNLRNLKPGFLISMGALWSLGAAWAATAPSGGLPVRAPTDLIQEVSEAWNYNVRMPVKSPQTGALALMEARKRMEPIYHFLVPYEESIKMESQYLSQDSVTQHFVFEEKEGKRYVRIFVTPHNQGVEASYLEYFRSQGYVLEQKFFGFFIPSNQTYKIFDPETGDRLQIKFQHAKGKDKKVYNSQSNAFSSIQRSDAAESILRSDSQALGVENVDILPEHFAAQVAIKEQPLSYAYSTRLETPVGAALTQGQRLVPLHVLLDSTSLLKKVSRHLLGQDNPDEWIQKEYLPKLAHFHFSANFILGLYFEGHTQNLFAVIDEEKGQILKLVSRDMNDIMIDPLARILGGLEPFVEPDTDDVLSRMHRSFVDGDPSVEGFRSKYDHQAMAMRGSEKLEHRLTDLGNSKYFLKMLFFKGLWLKEYKKLVENHFGLKIEFVGEQSKWFEELETAGNSLEQVEGLSPWKQKEFLDHLKGWQSEGHARFGALCQEVYNQVSKKVERSIRHSFLMPNQAEMAERFSEKHNTQKTLFLEKGSREVLEALIKDSSPELKFFRDQEGIYAAFQGRVLAFAQDHEPGVRVLPEGLTMHHLQKPRLRLNRVKPLHFR